MKNVMSIAAGLAVGYFLYQYLKSNSAGKTAGRLQRSAADKKLAGVCGGIAAFLGVDSTIVRLAWALLACGWGTGVLAYIICAVIMPEEGAEAGEPVKECVPQEK